MSSWKYSKERLLKHKYCAHIINAKKVICICGKEIKLNRRYEEDYLNRHSKSSGCKAKVGQRTIYNFYKPVQAENVESSEEEFDSDVYALYQFILMRMVSIVIRTNQLKLLMIFPILHYICIFLFILIFLVT